MKANITNPDIDKWIGGLRFQLSSDEEVHHILITATPESTGKPIMEEKPKRSSWGLWIVAAGGGLPVAYLWSYGLYLRLLWSTRAKRTYEWGIADYFFHSIQLALGYGPTWHADFLNWYVDVYIG